MSNHGLSNPTPSRGQVIQVAKWSLSSLPALRAIHTDQFSGTSSRCQSTCTSKLACVMPMVPEFHWCQSLVPVGFNIAHVLFVCRQLIPETGTGYWYQKTGQCVLPFRYVHHEIIDHFLISSIQWLGYRSVSSSLNTLNCTCNSSWSSDYTL